MSRRGALVLTTRLPWPLDDGGRIVSWQSLWAASRAYDTTLVSFVPPGEEDAPLPAGLTRLGVHCVRIPHRPPPPVVAAWRGLFGRWPYTLARYRDEAFSRTLRELVSNTPPAFALINHLHLATYVDSLRGTPMILREHNVEHLWMARYARSLGPTPAGFYARAQEVRLRRAESELCRRTALVLAIQEQEAEELRRLVPGARVEVVPVGVDLASFRDPEPADPPIVLLAAAFGWQPNAEGARRFLEEGWPRVKERVPTARLRLVGKDLPDSLAAYARRAHAAPVGYVGSIADEFARASVLVVPLWVGAGARVKIVEAMAARLPVAATRLAAAGLELRAGEDYAAADTAAGLGDEVAALLRAPERLASLAGHGRALAESRWSLNAIVHLQNELCGRILTWS